MRRLLPLLLTLVVWEATAEPRFRADDGNLWRLGDNPALAAVSGDAFSLGYAASPRGDWNNPTNDLQLISPLVTFGYTWHDHDSDLQFGTGLGPWEGVSFGYRAEVSKVGGDEKELHNFGVLWRPLDIVSAALTLDDSFNIARQWGGALALRPLTLLGSAGNQFTLTADTNFTTSSLSWESWGGRLSWEGSDLRVWYDTKTKAPGFEVTVALGASETTASQHLVGQALRWSSHTPDFSVFGPVVLKIQGTGELTASQLPPTPFGLGGHRWSLPELVAVLERAARDDRVVAVAFEDPPTVEGLAGAQTLRTAIEGLKSAGKKVYVHADTYTDSLGFQGWIAAADRVSLDPSGSLELTAGGSRRLYLKGLLDKVGIKFVNFAPWETKSFYNNLTSSSMPEAERAMLTRFLTDRDEQASELLASGRGSKLTTAADEAVASGPYLVSRQALSRGLVDALENRGAFDEYLVTKHPGTTVVDTLPVAHSQAWGPAVARRTVAVVHLVGDIVMGRGQAGRTIGQAATETLRSLRQDPSIRAVLLSVDSPGGAVLPSDALAEEVRKTVASGKPVVAVMGDVAASGGYYLSAPASKIFAQPGTLTGSIGVTAALFTAEEALKMLGVNADGVDLAPSAAFGDWTRPLSEATKAQWTAQIEAIYDRFITVAADGRHMSRDKLEPLARGQIYTGREALKLGLVDGTGGLQQAQDWLESQLGGPVDWMDFTPGEEDGWANLLAPAAAAAARASDSPTLRLAAALDQWAAPWTDVLEGVVARGPGPLVWADLP